MKTRRELGEPGWGTGTGAGGAQACAGQPDTPRALLLVGSGTREGRGGSAPLLPSTLHWELLMAGEASTSGICSGTAVGSPRHPHRAGSRLRGGCCAPAFPPPQPLLPVSCSPDLLEVSAPICKAKPPSTFPAPRGSAPAPPQRTPGTNNHKNTSAARGWGQERTRLPQGDRGQGCTRPPAASKAEFQFPQG